MDTVDLLLAFDWPYDEPFVGLLDRAMCAAGMRLMPVRPHDLHATLEALQCGRLAARAYLDRASDTDPSFEPLEAWATEHIACHPNPAGRRRHIWRKTNLHWEFIRAGVHTPHTLVVPAFAREPSAAPPDLTPLGVPFAVKPDLGGGGWGVEVNARTWADVERARRKMPDDDLILQQFVAPTVLMGRRAWFRVFYACGSIFPCWWDDETRLFGPAVSSDEHELLGLDMLWQIPPIAASISGLKLFSTEIAHVADGRWIVVDYVNDPVDLRFQPHAREGMPREVAVGIAQSLTAYLTPGIPPVAP